MTPLFFYQGILILALGQPLSLAPKNGVVWFSAKDYLKVQSHPGEVTLLPVKKGLLYLSGFNLKNSKITPTFITTPANYLALRKCTTVKSIKITENSLVFDSKDIFSLPLHCGFDDLTLGPPDIMEGPPPLSTRKIGEVHRQFYSAEKVLQKSGIKVGFAEWKNGKRSLSVHSSISEQRILQKIPEHLRPFYEIDIRNHSTPGKNLIFELTLFEFSKQRARKLGLKWPKSVSLFSIDKLGRNQLNLLDSSGEEAKEISLEADFGESQGVGKVIAQPTLRTQPGIESRFLSGGEFPVKNSNAFNAQTSWKSYGLKISLKPSAESKVGDTEVAVDFKLEFSEPNMEYAVEGTPSIFQRQLESRFDLRSDELTVLTSMITLREGKGRDGVAILGQIPILSLLFAQNSKLSSNTELWFALRPTWEEIPIRSASRKLELENAL